MGWLDNLLGVNDPSQAAALSLGANLLSSGGPSRMPISTGQALGNALMEARQSGMVTEMNMRRNQLVQAQIMHALAQAESLHREKKQQKYLAIGDGSYLDTETGQIHQSPRMPKEATPHPDVVAAQFAHPDDPVAQRAAVANALKRKGEFAPPPPANNIFMPTGPNGEIYGFNPRNPSSPTPTGLQAPPKPAGTNVGFRDTQALRKEFEGRQEVKDYRSAIPIYKSIAGTPETPAGDLNYIYGVGKILDPNSVVREGEMKLVIQSGSPLQRILGTGSWIVGQNRLTSSQRAELAALMSQRMGALQSQFDSAATQFSDLATRYGFNPGDVILNSQSLPSSGGNLSDAAKAEIARRRGQR